LTALAVGEDGVDRREQGMAAARRIPLITRPGIARSNSKESDFVSKSKKMTPPSADDKTMPPELEKAQLLDGDGAPSDEELQEFAEDIAETSTGSDSPKSWKDLAADEINAAAIDSVRVNLPTAVIKYSGEILTSRVINVFKDEELARGWLVSRLGNALGYRHDRIRLENVYVAGRGKKGTPENSVRIDVIVEKADQAPFYFIEVKAPDKFESDRVLIDQQLFAVAALHHAKTTKRPTYLVYYTVEEFAGALRDKAVIIDYAKYPTFADWSSAGMPSVSDTLGARYDRPKKIPYTKGGPRTLNAKFTPGEIKDLATSLHNVLWGGGSTGDTEVFTSLVNIILTKIQDEYRTTKGSKYQFQVLESDLDEPEQLYERLNSVYRTALEQQLGKKGKLLDQHIVNKEKFPLAKLVFAVAQLERYSFVDGKNSLNGKDLLGDFFEQIQRDGFKQSKGQFFTPVNVVKFMLYATDMDRLSINMLNKESKLPHIIDPSCGSATFLIEAMKMVTTELKYRQFDKIEQSTAAELVFQKCFKPDHTEHQWARECLYGIEHNFDLATAAKVNMILHGDGSANIFHKDGLKPFKDYKGTVSPGTQNVLEVRSIEKAYAEKEVNEQFHFIISNPPFSVDLDADTKTTLGRSFLFGDKKNSENLFIERYWQLLKEGGRMAIVLPESIFDTSENKYIRLFLFKFFHVRAVVSLPQLAFVPYTQTKTSILFAQKKTALDVTRWTSAWEAHSKKYLDLSTRMRAAYKIYVDGAKAITFPSMKGRTDANARTDVEALLGTQLTTAEAALSIKDLLLAKRHFIDLALEVDKDSAEVFGRVNCNWVMSAVLAASVDDAKKLGDPSIDQNSEIYLAEATSIGYKRSKRGEIVQPNDLFSLEIAPTRIDVKAVAANYDKALEDMDQKLAAGEKRKKLAGTAKDVAAKIQAQIDELKKKRAELAAEKAAVTRSLAKFYGADGALLPAHTDRTDVELLGVFERPLMHHLRSNAILLDPTKPRTILDEMRAKGLWT
jgi:type I restriction enzyme M protein